MSQGKKEIIKRTKNTKQYHTFAVSVLVDEGTKENAYTILVATLREINKKLSENSSLPVEFDQIKYLGYLPKSEE